MWSGSVRKRERERESECDRERKRDCGKEIEGEKVKKGEMERGDLTKSACASLSGYCQKVLGARYWWDKIENKIRTK